MRLTLEEAHRIIDRSDPRAEKFYNNDPVTVEAVHEAFAEQYPGEIDLHEDGALQQITRGMKR